MYLVEGPKVLYRLALSALKLYAVHGAVSADTPLHSQVSVLLCTLPEKEKTQWFHDAFSIQLTSWSKLLSTWTSQLSSVKYSGGSDHHDGPLPLPTYHRKIVSDKSSEILTDETWPLVWSWLPEWITCERPECVFRSSRDGYK